MIKDSLEEFIKYSNFLIDHIDLLEKHENLVKSIIHKNQQDRTPSEQEYLSRFIPNKRNEKNMLYISNIIFLYGILEKFVESAIMEYINEKNAILLKFSEQTDTFQQTYLERWMKLYGKFSHEKFSHLDLKSIVSNLYGIVDTDDCILLGECFLPESGNYKHSKIVESLKGLGFGDFDRKFGKYEPLRSFMQEENRQVVTNKFTEIDDITDRRNEVSHQGIPDDILEPKIVKQYVEIIKKYAESLIAYLNDKLFAERWTKLSAICPVIKYENYYQGHEAYDFRGEKIKIKVGSKVLAMASKESYPNFHELNVESLCILDNGEQKMVDEIDSEETIVFAVKFNINIRNLKKVIVLP